MEKSILGCITGITLALILNGCAPAAHDASGMRNQDKPTHGIGNDGAAPSHDSYPTKLENCVTAVGADRSRCTATN